MREIQLTKGYVALIDDEDFELVSARRWQALVTSPTRIYATSGGRILMHRLLVPGASEVDHRDGDGLNNTRSNLRACQHHENLWNQRLRPGRKIKGVHLDGSSYQAQIMFNGIRLRRRFKTEAEAIVQYDEWSRLHHGAFARPNSGTPDGV